MKMDGSSSHVLMENTISSKYFRMRQLTKILTIYIITLVLYEHANKDFKGNVSVPLLWDTQKATAFSNSSQGITEMIATQVRSMGTRNQDILLFPSRLENPMKYAKPDQLDKMLYSRVTTAVCKMNATQCGRDHDRLVNEYYSTLDELQDFVRMDLT